MWESVQVTALSHELAHTFNITHVWGNNNSGATTDEHVTRDQSNPNYNALTAGDKIHDTAAMTSFWGEIGHQVRRYIIFSIQKIACILGQKQIHKELLLA